MDKKTYGVIKWIKYIYTAIYCDDLKVQEQRVSQYYDVTKSYIHYFFYQELVLKCLD